MNAWHEISHAHHTWLLKKIEKQLSMTRPQRQQFPDTDSTIIIILIMQCVRVANSPGLVLLVLEEEEGLLANVVVVGIQKRGITIWIKRLIVSSCIIMKAAAVIATVLSLCCTRIVLEQERTRGRIPPVQDLLLLLDYCSRGRQSTRGIGNGGNDPAMIGRVTDKGKASHGEEDSGTVIVCAVWGAPIPTPYRGQCLVRGPKQRLGRGPGASHPRENGGGGGNAVGSAGLLLLFQTHGGRGGNHHDGGMLILLLERRQRFLGVVPFVVVVRQGTSGDQLVALGRTQKTKRQWWWWCSFCSLQEKRYGVVASKHRKGVGRWNKVRRRRK